MKHLLSLFFAFVYLLSFAAPLSAFQGDPSGIVHGSVDVISGSYLEANVDAIIAAPTPLVLKRSYTSTKGFWQFFPECALIVGKKNNTSYALTSESSGTPLVYIQTDTAATAFHPDFKDHNKGIVNTARGILSASTNLKNNRIKKVEDGYALTLCNGTVRLYKRCSKPNLGPLCESVPHKLHEAQMYRLVSETLPSKNKMVYHYDKEGRLEEIAATNHLKTKEFCSVKFSYKEDKVVARASDGQSVTYKFHKWLLETVKSTSRPEIEYLYTSVGKRKVLEKKKLPDGRFLEIEYDRDAQVKALFTPLSKKPLYTFEYHSKKTEVTDGKGYKTKYSHENGALLAVSKYEKRELYSVEKFFWRKQNGMTELASKTIEDHAAKVILATKYEYDAQGNVTEEKEINNPLAQDLVISKSTRWNAQDSFHNPQQTKDASGNTIDFEYKPETNLVTKKIVRDAQSRIKKRHFYFYNDDAVLVKEVTDDGTNTDYNSLIGATERHIVQIEPRSFSKHQKEVIFEKYVDLSVEAECLKRKICHELDAQGRIVKRLTYDAVEVCVKTEEFTYNDHGKLIRKVNPIGDVTLYQYDSNDNCVQCKEETTGRKITFVYDLQNQIVATKDQYPNAPLITTAYKYDLHGKKRTSIDRYGNEITYKYDFLSRLTAITYPTVFNEKKEAIQPQTTLTYDVLGNVTSKKDPKGYIEEMSYAGRKLVAHKYPDGTNASYRWNKDGTLRDYNEANGILNASSYDFAGRVLSQSRTVPSEGFSVSIDDHTWRYSAFHCLEAVDAERYSSLYTYNSKGELVTEIEPSQRSSTQEDEQSKRTDFEYDTLGRPIRTIRWISKTEYITEVVKYDRLDRVIESWYEQPDGSRLSHKGLFYDTFGNLCKRQAEGGVFEEVSYVEGSRPCLLKNSSGNLTRIEYIENKKNHFGQFFLEKRITNSHGVLTCIQHDALGREVLILTKDPFGTEISKKELLYDAAGNLAATIEKQIRTEWKYGPKNRLEVLKEAAGTENERSTTYSYNNLGYVELSHLSNDPLPYHYYYTRDGKLRRVYQNDPNGKVVILSDFSYDRRGQVIEAKSCDAVTVRHRYTANGDIQSEVIDDGGGNYSLDYSFDRLGRITSITHSDGSIEYQYKGLLPLCVIRKDRNRKECYRHSFTAHDLEGRPITEELIYNSATQNTRYDKGLLTSIETPYLQESITSRDLEGNPLQIVRNAAAKNFAYDHLGQLAKEDALSYQYDTIGNLLQKNGQAFSYNGLNQLTCDGTSQYRYDGVGNLKEIISPSETISFSYNAMHKPTAVLKDGKEVMKYRFDAFGRCQSMHDVQSKIEKRAFFVGSTEIGSFDKGNRLFELKVPKYVSDRAEGQVAIEIGKKVYAPLTDLMGNVAALVDPTTKQVVESYKFSAFGKETIFDGSRSTLSSSAVNNPWRYKGHRTDEKTGFVTMGHRFYSPELHRFISEDPLGHFAGDNLYRYAENNPLRYSDPTGLLSEIGPCTCHSDCEWFKSGQCGHGGGIIPDYDPTPKRMEVVIPSGNTGGYFGNAVKGIAHGALDYLVNSFHDLERMAYHMGAGDMDFELHEREHMIGIIQETQAAQMATIEDKISDLLHVDLNNEVYQKYRSRSTTTLEVASLVAGGYGAVKGVIAFRKLAKVPVQLSSALKVVNGVKKGAKSGTQSILNEINANPFSGSISQEVMIVDLKGNVIRVRGGQRLTASPDGKWMQVRDKLGNSTGLRKDGPHSISTHKDPRALRPHAHVPGVTNTDGTPWLSINQ